MSSNQSVSRTQDIIETERWYAANAEELDAKPPSTYSLVGSLMKLWTDVSMINYTTSKPLDIVTSVQSVLRRRSVGGLGKEHSVQSVSAPIEVEVIKAEEEIITEEFPMHVTPLMNEDNLWGCFYTFPEIYGNMYSPVVQIRNVQDVPELVDGELTRDMVTACLSYLKRSPILGDYVYIKLDLSSKHLMSIDVLKYYKYLVYLDLSSNLLTRLDVLSSLPYLQLLSVSYNRLSTVLEYETPQWFLTEVHYKYNSVKRIRDLTAFWSITILDLSHNNIKSITGLENLRYLRHLDLSFNHIQRLENLNHLRLLWLDVSYNNISSCEFGPNSGLWTLLHLEYLNLNENNLTTMKMFSYCTRIRELHARNNRLSILLELAVYMRQMRRLIVLDLRANPICSTPGYKDVVINTFSMLLSLDAAELNPIEQRTLMMDMNPDIIMHATRRLLRLLYIQQLGKARVSPFIPPGDTQDLPLVIIVGHEGVGKGCLTRRLARECSANIQLAYQHTTAPYHFAEHYKEITRSKFDDMLLAGDFLTYTEMDGESYGLSREEACVKEGTVKIIAMSLIGALMLTLRGYRPYLILATCRDRRALAKTQHMRKEYRNLCSRERVSLETPLERSTLQVLLSGRIIITGIINEILVGLPDDKEQSEFVMESECSLMMDSDARQATRDYAKCIDILALLNSSTTSLEEVCRTRHTQDKGSMEERSLYSLFKGTDEYTSYVNGQNQESVQERARKSTEHRQSRLKSDKHSSISQRLVVPDGSKSSKSVTFTSQDNDAPEQLAVDPIGLFVEPRTKQERKEDPTKTLRSISTRMPWAAKGQSRLNSHASIDDSDLWFAFLTETGCIQASDTNQLSDTAGRVISAKNDDDSIMHQMDDTLPADIRSTNIRDNYESIHSKRPGIFWDSIAMDDLDEAFLKVRGIIRNIVEAQKNLKPMFDIDFANLSDYPTVEKRLATIRNQIAPQQLFY